MTVIDNLFKGQEQDVVAVIDQRLASILKDLATTRSKHYKQECEIRAHELLGILNDLASGR
jgi:hypothetical protein